MPIDIDAAEQFVYANARLLDRFRLARLLHEASPGPVLVALRTYRNNDGGFGNALEPDVRCPNSEPAATLHALDVLVEIGAHDDPMVAEAAAWVASIADPAGGVPFVLPTAAAYPHAPWMESDGSGSHLTFAITAALQAANFTGPSLGPLRAWCWERLARPDELSGYWVKFALDFLDTEPDYTRAATAVEQLRPLIGADGSVPVPGGTENERITALTLSPQPGRRSRVLFTDHQIQTELDLIERGQQDDGGWTFDWLSWSPGQSVEWRGLMTLRALTTLHAHGRV